MEMIASVLMQGGEEVPCLPLAQQQNALVAKQPALSGQVPLYFPHSRYYFHFEFYSLLPSYFHSQFISIYPIFLKKHVCVSTVSWTCTSFKMACISTFEKFKTAAQFFRHFGTVLTQGGGVGSVHSDTSAFISLGKQSEMLWPPSTPDNVCSLLPQPFPGEFACLMLWQAVAYF